MPTLSVSSSSNRFYFAFVFFVAVELFAAGFFTTTPATTAAGFLLPFFASTLRSCVAVNPCCLHNFFTVSKSVSFESANSLAFSSARDCSCLAISSSRCCGEVIWFSPVVKTVQSQFLKLRAVHSLASFCACAICWGVIRAAIKSRFLTASLSPLTAAKLNHMCARV